MDNGVQGFSSSALHILSRQIEATCPTNPPILPLYFLSTSLNRSTIPKPSIFKFNDDFPPISFFLWNFETWSETFDRDRSPLGIKKLSKQFRRMLCYKTQDKQFRNLGR